MKKAKISKDNDTLHERFLAGDCPKIEEFHGEYKVRMLTWYLPDFTRWKHRKLIARGKGFNVFWHNARWGRFSLKYLTVEGAKYAVIFDYQEKRNNVIIGRIRDHLRKVGNGLYLGTLNYFIFGKLRFIGYFLAEKDGSIGTDEFY